MFWMRLLLSVSEGYLANSNEQQVCAPKRLIPGRESFLEEFFGDEASFFAGDDFRSWLGEKDDGGIRGAEMIIIGDGKYLEGV